MTKFTIDVGVVQFKRGGQVMTVDMGQFPTDIIAQLAMHGAIQKIGDAAAGKEGNDALIAMNAVIDTLKAGDWGRTRGGTGEDPVLRYVRAILREKMSDATKAEYKALAPEDKDDFLNAKYEGLAEEMRDRIYVAAQARKKIDDDAKKAAKALATDLSI